MAKGQFTIADLDTPVAPTQTAPKPTGTRGQYTLADLEGGTEQADKPTGFWDSLWGSVKGGLDPTKIPDAISHAFDSPFDESHMAEAERYAKVLAPKAVGLEAPDTAEAKRIAGEVAGGTIDQALLGLITAGVIKGAKYGAGKVSGLRTPNPDLEMFHAANPSVSDTADFMEYAPRVRETIKRGERLAGVKITDIPSALEAIDASKKELMDQLEAHKVRGRAEGLKMSVADLRERAINALPKGLEDIHPEEYASAKAEINKMFEGTDSLNTDQVFDQSILANNKLAAFHASPEARQGSKLIVNAGDVSAVKATADAYREWIKENLGEVASSANSHWGEVSRVENYLKTRLKASVAEQPVTPLEKGLSKIGISPEGAVGISKEGLALKAIKTAVGRPNTIDDLLKSAFAKTREAEPPLYPDIIRMREQNGGPNPAEFQRQLPPASSQIDVSGVITPDVTGQMQQAATQLGGQRQIEGAPQPSIPTSGTRFIQSDVSGVRTINGRPVDTNATGPHGPNTQYLPPATDNSGPIKSAPYIANILRDKLSKDMYEGRAYSQLLTHERQAVDRRLSRGVKLNDLVQ